MDYITKHQLQVYIEDCVVQLLLYKDQHNKVNTRKFLSDYFSCVQAGNHTLFKYYRFVVATAYNRACFVKMFWRAFHYIAKRNDYLSVVEYHSLLTLLCHDFPADFIQILTLIIASDGKEVMENGKLCLSYREFVLTFQFLFVYQDFLQLLEEQLMQDGLWCTHCLRVGIYGSMKPSDGSANLSVVRVPSTSSNPHSISSTTPSVKSKQSGKDHQITSAEVDQDGDDVQMNVRKCLTSLQHCLKRISMDVNLNYVWSPDYETMEHLLHGRRKMNYLELIKTFCMSGELSDKLGFLPVASCVESELDSCLTMPSNTMQASSSTLSVKTQPSKPSSNKNDKFGNSSQQGEANSPSKSRLSKKASTSIPASERSNKGRSGAVRHSRECSTEEEDGGNEFSNSSEQEDSVHSSDSFNSAHAGAKRATSSSAIRNYGTTNLKRGPKNSSSTVSSSSSDNDRAKPF